MSIVQRTIKLRPYAKGFHLITSEVEQALPELREVDAGLLNVFIKHSSASLTINENADPDVRHDMHEHFEHYVPENASYYYHTYEGPDDMPAHIKASTLGSSVTIPVTNGRLALGTWQGIYLGEHRVTTGGRSLVLTLYS